MDINYKKSTMNINQYRERSEQISRAKRVNIHQYQLSIFYFLFSIFLLSGLSITSSAFASENNSISKSKEDIVSKTLDAISGYYKMLASFTKSTDTKEDIYSVLQRLRLEFKPKLTEHFDFNLTLDHELLVNDFAHTSDFNLIRQENQRSLSFLDGDRVISDTDHVYEKISLYRLYLKYESAHSRWIFGKQLIDWGRMRFHSPLDLYNQPLPSDIEADERIGFDAFNIELFSDNFSGINLIYGPGRNEDKTSYGLRLFKKLKTYDTFLAVAKHEKEKMIGIGFDGYIKDAGFRGEMTYTKSGQERYPRFALGADYSFPKTTFLLEYFYNGAANGDYAAFSDSLTESRKRLSLKKHLASFMLTHEITPLLKFKGSCIYDIIGKSAFLNPELRYNIKESLDAACGTQLFFETKDSEFQDYNNLYYIELKYFF